ncbi:ArnT family glycosyltransferase [Planctomicrobium sp. SH668]|uniref:ArnT family glycosyltransferase n=1 Tax=Planctomicrobium sp. SH668 TaxID=3448126 RepID=UPI003F5C3D95
MKTDPLHRSDSPLQRLGPLLAVIWLLLFWVLFFTSELPNASNSKQTVDRLYVIFELPNLYENLLSPSQDKNSSIFNLIERIDVLAVAMLIVIGSLAFGRLILRGLKLNNSFDRTEELAIAGGIGFAATSLFALGTGLAGWLSQPFYLLTFIALIAGEIWLTLRSRRQKQQTFIHTWPEPAPKWLVRICVLVGIPFLGAMLLGSMLPPTDFDVKEYHLGGPKEYFQAGKVHFLAHDVYTSFPFLTEMLSLTGMVIRGDWQRGAYAGQAVLMFFAPLTTLGVFCVTRRVAGSIAGWLAALSYITIPWTYRISIIAYTEGALCCYVILPVLAFQIWLKWKANLNEEQNLGILSQKRNRLLFVLGLLAGSAVSTKYPGMVLVAVPFAAAVLVSDFNSKPRSLKTSLTHLVVYGIGVVVAFGPWMAKNLLETGNPVYPLLYGLFGGIDWNEAMHKKWQAAHPASLFRGSWSDFAGVFYRNDWQSPLLFGFAPLAFLKVRNRSAFAIAGYAIVLFACWYVLTHRLDRFWVPMNSVMAVLAGIGIAAVLRISSQTDTNRKLSSNKKRTSTQQEVFDEESPSPVLRLLPAALIAGAIFYNFGFISSGLCGYNAYFLTYAKAEADTKTQSVKIVEWLNLPENSKVLFVGEAELFDAKFPYAYNTVFDKNLLEIWTSDLESDGTWKMHSPEQILEKLRSEKITHLFVNWNEILRYRTTYGYTDFVTPERIKSLIDAGILEVVAIPETITLRSWEDIDKSWTSHIQKNIPELEVVYQGKRAMLQYQCFRIKDD